MHIMKASLEQGNGVILTDK